MNTLISCDWDFFLWRGSEAKKSEMIAFPGTLKESKINGVWLFDWGHSESQQPALQQMIWQSRWMAFQMNGIDPVQATGMRTDKACVDVRTFIRELDKSFDFDDSLLYMADSHAFGYFAALEAQSHARGPVKVVHFDAHSDLGYGDEIIQRELKTGNFDCASWLFHALKQGLVSEVDVVYPDWQNDRDWKSLISSDYIKPYLSKIRRFHWSGWLKQKQEVQPVAMVNIARSSAWTPPWFDKQFDEFVDTFRAYELTCLDCSNTYGAKVGGHDACKAREWVEPPAIEREHLEILRKEAEERSGK